MINTDLENALKVMVGSQEALEIYVGIQKIWSASKLPSTYTELEYISSSGTQYIDLGCQLCETSEDIIIDIKTRMKSYTAANTISLDTLLGMMKEVSPYPGTCIRRSHREGSNGIALWCVTTHPLTEYDTILSTLYMTKLGELWEVTNSHIVIDNVSLGLHDLTTTLFCGLDSNGDPFRYALADLYYLKLTKGSTVIRELVPAKRNSDGVAGLYDVENGVFYTSSSNTELIAGPEVIKNPIYDFELESIESTGTQYIDTGIIIDAPYEAEIVFGLPTGLSNAYSRIMGVGNDQSAAYQYCNVETCDTNYTQINCSNRDISVTNNTGVEKINLTDKNQVVINNTNSTSYSVVYNGVLLKSFGSINITYSKSSTGSLYIFTTHRTLGTNGNILAQDVPGDFTAMKLYSFRFYIGGELVRDMIPVSKNGVGYMYDKITKQLFGNQGTGTFLSNKLNAPATNSYISYIGSSGTLYIDTGIMITGPYRAEIEFETPTSLTATYSKLMGVGNDSNAAYLYCLIEINGSNLNNMKCSNRGSDDKVLATYITLDLNSTIHKIVMENPDSDTMNIIYNGTDQGTISNCGITYDKASSGALYLFTVHSTLNKYGELLSQDTVGGYVSYRLHSFKFYLGNQLIRDMVPVRRNRTGYLFDRVSNKLFANQGFGDFNLGLNIYDEEIEYLQSTGTLYIDLNITPDSDTGIYIKAVHDVHGNNFDETVIGCRNDSNNTRWFIGHSSRGWYYGFGNFVRFADGYKYDDEIAEVTLNYLNSGTTTLNVDSQSYSLNLSTLGFTPTNNIRLFGISGVTGDYTKWSGKIYEVKITQGNQIIHDLIPVKKDGIGYMYDKVSKLLFDNLGTGNFVLGPNKVVYDSELVYLEGTGIQWIDTLIHPTTGYGFELYGGFTVFNNNEFFGGGTNYNNGLGICTHGSSYGVVVGTTEVCQISASNNVMHLFRVNTDGTVYIDNEYKGQSNTEMPDGTYTMNIFKHSSNGSPRQAKIYYCKIFNSGGLVFDGIPVRIGQTGYIYDRVTKLLFGNSGTGSFVLGPDKIEYTSELEYLQSTGTLYINTELLYNGNYRFETKFVCDSLSSPDDANSGTVLGTRALVNNNTFQLSTYQSGSFSYNTTINSNLGFETNTEYIVEFRSDNKLYINNQESLTLTNSSFNPPNSLLIFALYDGPKVSERFVGKIYYVKLYDGSGNLILDLIPVRVGLIGHMYDRVSKRLYNNVGSGNFTLGPDKIN